MELIAENLSRVEERIAVAATRAGRSAEEIALLAVSKTHAAEKVQAAAEAGQILFGESRVQEARSKIPAPSLTLALAFHWTPAKEQDPARPASF